MLHGVGEAARAAHDGTVPYFRLYIWFRPQGSYMDGIRNMSEAASIGARVPRCSRCRRSASRESLLRGRAGTARNGVRRCPTRRSRRSRDASSSGRESNSRSSPSAAEPVTMPTSGVPERPACAAGRAGRACPELCQSGPMSRSVRYVAIAGRIPLCVVDAIQYARSPNRRVLAVRRRVRALHRCAYFPA